MNACILLALVSAAAPAGREVDGPTHISRPLLSQGSGHLSYEDTPPPQPIAGDILWDQLDMARNCTYTTGNGNACSGVRVLGGLYGLQLCDDFVLDGECTVTEVTGAFLTFFGAPPVGGANVTFYQDGGCRPLDAFFAADCHAVTVVAPFRDCRFGLAGLYVTAALSDGGVTLPPGRWFVDIQPEDETGNGDWYYQARDTASLPTGCDSHMRDSRPNDPCCTQGQPGYGFSEWTSAGAAGFGAGDAAFQIIGKCGGAAACNGREYMNVSCSSRTCGTQAKAVLFQATPGSTHTFCLDDAQCITKIANNRGKAVYKWCPVSRGRHVVTTECDIPWEFDTILCGSSSDRCRYKVDTITYYNGYTECGYTVGDKWWTDETCPSGQGDCDDTENSLIKDSHDKNKCCASFKIDGCSKPKKRFTPLNAACP